MRRLRITIGALIAVIFLAAMGTVAFLYLRSEQVTNVQEFQEDLRVGLIESCEKNGNPLRKTVQSLLEERIKNAKDIVEQLEHFFPNVDPKELREALQKQLRADRARIKKIAPLDCDALYSK